MCEIVFFVISFLRDERVFELTSATSAELGSEISPRKVCGNERAVSERPVLPFGTEWEEVVGVGPSRCFVVEILKEFASKLVLRGQ